MLNVGFLWHFHQPDYRDPETGEFILPWVRLHATSGYTDMIELAHRFPSAGQMLNFTPVLLDQLETYISGEFEDVYFRLSRLPPADLTESERSFILTNFFMANPGTQIEPYPRYRELWQRRDRLSGETAVEKFQENFSDRDIRDIQVWFNLSWMGWSTRGFEPVARLFVKGSEFDENDKQELLDAQAMLIKRIVERLGTMQNDSVSELTFTPYYHPILPLICDAGICQTDLSGPGFRYPDDARWHVSRGRELFQRITGYQPCGMWIAEGAVSAESVELCGDLGVNWLVSDEGILCNSKPAISDRSEIYRPHQIKENTSCPIMFFRDRHLSDAIGFSYQHMKPDDAVYDLVRNLEQIAGNIPVGEDRIVVIALDGENPWSYFSDRGEGFLTGLMERLDQHADIDVVTISAFLDKQPDIRFIDHLHSGSWIDNDFHIWIGDPVKNRAWELLAEARGFLQDIDNFATEEKKHTALRHMYAAEGSDWFWWYGEPNHSPSDSEFDRLFRSHLQMIYKLSRHEIPSSLLTPVKAVKF